MQACWALLLDLLASSAPARTLLPPLAAVVDVWPGLLEALQPAAADGSSSGNGPPQELAGCHSALQHLCGLAAAEEEHAAEEQETAAAAGAAGAGDVPPPLLLERQPVAATEFLRQLGQQLWGWEADAAGSAGALQQLRAALQQEPGAVGAHAAAAKAAEAAAAEATGTAAVIAPVTPADEPMHGLGAVAGQPGADAADRVMRDGQVEEL